MPLLSSFAPARRQALIAAGAGFLFTLAFPPFNFWPLALVGLVPLIHLTRQNDAPRALTLGWLFGACLALGQLYWILYVLTTYGGMNWGLAIWVQLMMVAVVGLYPGLFATGLVLTNRAGVSPILAAPILWAGSEYLKALAITGFPWLPLGNALSGALPLVQSAEIWGVFGVSALAALINALLERAVWGIQRNKTPRARELAALAAVAVFVAGGWLWGSARMGQVDAEAAAAPRLAVSVVQANLTIAQILDSEQELPIIRKEINLTDRAAKQVSGRPWLVVWPESSAPFYFVSEARPSIPVYRAAARLDAWILTGTMGSVERNGAYQATNRAWLVNPRGEPASFYDKVHLVPFGEYVPLRDILFFVRALASVGGDMAPGATGDTLDMAGVKLGPLICYESIFPELARSQRLKGAEIIVNQTNDGWFGPTGASRQHMSHLVLRCIENRMACARAANTGVSGFVGPAGRISGATEIFTQDVGSAELPILRGTTFFDESGHWTGLGCLYLSLAGALWALWAGRRRKKENRDV